MRILELEISNYFWFIIFLIHSLKHQGISTTIKIFLIGLIYGFLCESYGVWSGSFSENGYLIYISHKLAPLATIIGWVIFYYFTFYLTENFVNFFYKIKPFQFFKFPIFKSILSGIIALSYDLFLDPVACYAKWWIWSSKYKNFFLGVPLINFVAWFFAVSIWAYFYWKINELNLSEKTKIIILLISVPFAAFIAGSLTFGFMKFVNTLEFYLPK